MFKSKYGYPIAKCKQICFLFIFLFSSFSSLLAQESVSQDSAAIHDEDSINRAELIQDSLNYVNLHVNVNAPNHYLDSLKALIIVSDNDFVGWFDKMNKLHHKGKDIIKEQSIPKVKRPLWVLLLVVVFFLSLGLVRIFFYNNFYNIVYGFYNDRVLAQINKEDSLLTSWPYIFLYIIFTLSLGLFITIYRGYILHIGHVDFIVFLKTSSIIALLFLLKLVVVKMIGVVFEIERLVREYIVFLYLFYFNSVLILMPLLLFVAFLPATYFNFLLIFFVSLIAILFVYRFLKIFLTLFGGLRFSIFYLILYLCTLEIAPILILVKSLNK